MKRKKAFLPLFLFIGCTLSSCYTYRQIQTTNKEAENVQQKIEQVECQKTYRFMMEDGYFVQMKVSQVTRDGFAGKGVLMRNSVRLSKVDSISSKTITSVKVKRFNPVATIVAVVVPVGLIALIGAKSAESITIPAYVKI